MNQPARAAAVVPSQSVGRQSVDMVDPSIWQCPDIEADIALQTYRLIGHFRTVQQVGEPPHYRMGLFGMQAIKGDLHGLCDLRVARSNDCGVFGCILSQGDSNR